MANFVDIEIFCLGQTKMNRDEVRKWLDFMGAEEYEIQDEDIISDPEHIVGLAAKRCYKSYLPNLNPNVSKVRKEWDVYFNNILESGHGSVLEHMTYTYAFENVSRVFTAEMNRHRAGVAISEQSLRYVRFSNIPFWMPLSMRADENVDRTDIDKMELENKKLQTRLLIQETLATIEKNYDELVELWDFENMTDFHQKKIITSMLRRIVPLGVATGAAYTMNGRAIRHITTMRCDSAAEEEICYVFSLVAKDMVQRSPLLFSDFKQTEDGFWYPENKKV
jgi:thymidylate synthase (FAD)